MTRIQILYSIHVFHHLLFSHSLALFQATLEKIALHAYEGKRHVWTGTQDIYLQARPSQIHIVLLHLVSHS